MLNLTPWNLWLPFLCNIMVYMMSVLSFVSFFFFVYLILLTFLHFSWKIHTYLSNLKNFMHYLHILMWSIVQFIISTFLVLVTLQVKIVNSTELLEILNFSKNQKLSPCVLVMFYAPWCYFCAKTAPHYNALARAFPQLNILAVDTSHFS